jgi:hypothetical protein
MFDLGGPELLLLVILVALVATLVIRRLGRTKRLPDKPPEDDAGW